MRRSSFWQRAIASRPSRTYSHGVCCLLASVPDISREVLPGRLGEEGCITTSAAHYVYLSEQYRFVRTLFSSFVYVRVLTRLRLSVRSLVYTREKALIGSSKSSKLVLIYKYQTKLERDSLESIPKEIALVIFKFLFSNLAGLIQNTRVTGHLIGTPCCRLDDGLVG
jgi:hypothetical protein